MRTGPRCAFLLFAFLLAGALPEQAGAARAIPDSLAELRRLMGSSRPSDPALPALAERILARRELVRGPRHPDVAEALLWLGRVRLLRAEYPLADSILQRALHLRRAARPPDTLATVTAVAWLAEAQRVSKKLARADSSATEGLALLARSSVPDTVLEIRLRATLGNVLAERRQNARACEQLERVVLLASARARPDSLELGQTYRNLARAAWGGGDLRGARGTFERSATILERFLGPEHPELGTTLYLSAMAAGGDGDYVAGRRFAERALRIRERAFGRDHPVVAITASTLGGALANLGDFAGALLLYERAVAIQRAAPRVNPFDLALALNNLGSGYLAVRDGPRARQSLQEARAVREAAFGAGSGSGVWSGTQLANAMAISGDLQAAELEIDRAIAQVDSSNFAGLELELADALQMQGKIAYEAGRRAAALASFDRSFTLTDSVLGIASPHTLTALAYRAIARAAMGRGAEAWADARRLEAESREYLQLSARSLSEYEALTLERSRASGLDLMLALATDATALEPEPRVELADAIMRARLLVLDQLADERRALPRDTSALAAPIRELEDAREVLARAMVAALRQDRALDSTVVLARARREAAERALAERSERFELGIRRSDVGFAQVAAALPRGSVLVSYVRYDAPIESMRGSGPADSSRLATRRYCALLLRAGERAPKLVPLATAPRLEAAVARWLEACAVPPSADLALARAAERRCDALGRTVRELAWDPLALSSTDRVFVVPDGVLHAVNFLALPDARGARLVERGPLLHRLTAERDLLPWEEADRAGHGLLALGGADFDHAEPDASPSQVAAAESPALSRSTVADSARLRFLSLPQTAAEVQLVVSLWRASAAPDADRTVELSGRGATEAAFKRLAPGGRVLHVATHGFALGGDARAQGITGTRGIGSVVSGQGRNPVVHGAALLPGLALAGANVVASAAVEDGFLTAEEITSLDLTGTQWAVLSACETGRSDPGAAEAVQGLQRAFRRAGVRTVIMSLWAVDDEATRSWMRNLYSARLLERLDTAAAVRAAGRQWLRERRAKGLDTHPFHWAAFVAAGDWR